MGGLLRTITGGMVSLSPPVGGTTMAHLGEKRLANNTRRIKYENRFRSILITVSPTNVEIFTISFAPIKGLQRNNLGIGLKSHT